jgi:hypothetical protein
MRSQLSVDTITAPEQSIRIGGAAGTIAAAVGTLSLHTVVDLDLMTEAVSRRRDEGPR